MDKKILVLFFLLFPHVLLFPQGLRETVYFRKGSSQLPKLDAAGVQKIVSFLQQNSTAKLGVTGYADCDGDEEANMALSEKRAQAVAAYFKARGIEPGRILLKFLGESKAQAAEESEKVKRESRRVEIGVIRQTRIPGLLGKFNREPQRYKITANKVADRDTMYFSDERLYLSIPLGSVCWQNGDPVNSDVGIEILWLTRKSDMILAGVHTQSDGEMLESAGMIHIRIFSEDEDLVLKNDAVLTLEFASKKSDMIIFNGQEQNGQINWKPETSETKVQLAVAGKGLMYQTNNPLVVKELSKTDHMLLSTNKLGWINCDRFYNVAGKTDLMVETADTAGTELRLVFKDINAVLPAVRTGEKTYVFRNIPAGKEVTLLAFRFANDQLYFAGKPLLIKAGGTEQIKPLKTTREVFEEKLKKLN